MFTCGWECQTAYNRDPYRRPIGTPVPISGSAARRVAISSRSASPLGEPPAVQLRREGVWGEFGPVDNFAVAADQLRFLSRQLSLPVSTMSQ
jgi:hypothetical protein